mmetsp:Transcript_14719/g.24362  ORF Transcript_14719/g.24362 Transcript_14719/m.24362 type:complete len:805 (-) Transcript_14719:692-3106(-)
MAPTPSPDVVDLPAADIAARDPDFVDTFEEHPEIYYAPQSCYKNPNPEPFPNGIKLSEVVRTMPAEVFEKSYVKAFRCVCITVVSVSFAVFMIHVLPWYLLPLAWAFAGTAVTGLFVVGHDCAHKSFTKSRVVNDVVGHIMMAPLIYPYESWRIKHDHHHKNTNKLDVDNAWQPFTGEWFSSLDPGSKYFMRMIKGPMWWFASVGHWIAQHFFLSKFEPEQRQRVAFSIGTVYAFMILVWPPLIYYTGITGFVKFWLMPWLGYHFWMSTFTMVHHTIPMIPFLPEKTWDDTKARLTYTVHCEYPYWIEFLCHQINVHVPHHVSTAIPCYNLRPAWRSLQQNWGKYIYECTFDWNLIKDITTKCHIYDKKTNYVSFETHEQREKEKRAQKSYSTSLTEGPFVKRLHPIHVPLLTITPLLALYGVLTCNFNMNTLIWAVIYYFFTGLGITAGYHRYWAHRSYDASLPMRLVLMLAGTGAVEGPIRWWSRDHRAHHRYTDTEKDPYSAKKGFFYSHIGWMLLLKDPKNMGKADISDLNEDPLVRFQHKNYLWMVAIMGLVFPAAVAYFGWGDWKGGLLIAGFARIVFVHHATFCVNSLAHFLGTQPFADSHTPKDSVITAVVTLGEGYHNFHHEFPQDYRNAIKFYQYDPTKWLIKFCSFFGLTYNLRQFPENEIVKGRVQMEQKRLDRLKATVKWAPDTNTLPEMTWEEFRAQSRTKENLENGIPKNKLKDLVVLDNLIHDATEFSPNHPGGVKILESMIGKDITEAFNGGVYGHSNAAHNLLSTMRIARLAVPVAVEKVAEKKEQ